MENKDQIKELFQQQLSNHQEAVRPEIWASVSSSIATPLGATASLSVLAKILISAGIITSVLIGGYFILATEDTVKQPTAPNSKQDYTSKDVIITDSLANKADKPLVLPNKQQKNAVLDYKNTTWLTKRLFLIAFILETMMKITPTKSVLKRLLQIQLSRKEIPQLLHMLKRR